MKYLPALEALADMLTAAGIRSALDWRGLNPPGVWVTPGPLTTGTLGDDYHALAHCTAVVPASEETQAYRELDKITGPLLESLAAAGYPVISAEPVTVGGSTSATSPLPAIRITTEIYLGE